MVEQVTYGTGWEGDSGLAPQDELFILKIPRQTIQEGGNTKEAHKDHKTSPLCCLYSCKVPQEAMEDQRKTLKRINQEFLGD